jgi:RPA family protein
MCVPCQKTARAARKASESLQVAKQPRVELRDQLGFFIGYEDQYTPEQIAEIKGRRKS